METISSIFSAEVHPFFTSIYFYLLLIFVAIAAATCLYIGFFIEVNSLTRKKLFLPRGSLSDFWLDKKILFFSDLHLGRGMPPKRLTNFVQLMQREKPDLILFGGDLSEDAHKLSQEQIETWIEILREFNPPLGIYSVRGNHDTESPEAKKMFAQICETLGVHVLNDAGLVLHGLALYGLEEMINCDYQHDKALDQLAETDHDMALVLLHQGDPAANIAQSKDFSRPCLFLSGHSHAGQIRPFNLHLYLEKMGWRYPYGLYIFPERNSQLFVSRGIGTVKIHARFAAPPEYVIISFKEHLEV